jgi:hypothetical protein
MSLKSAFQGVAKAVVDGFGDVRASATYLSVSSSAAVYDASSGQTNASYASTVNVRVIEHAFSHREIDGTRVRPQDQKALIPLAYLPGVTPKPGDRIVIDGVTWNVVAPLEGDPARALWQLQIRR